MGKILAQLKLSAEKRPTQEEEKQQRRRNNLVARLEEQLALAKAQDAGQEYLKTRTVYVDGEDGQRHAVEKRTPLRAWFWQGTNSVWYIELRYRNRVMDLGKKRTAIVVGDRSELVSTIELLIEAASGGEFDRALEAMVEGECFSG